MRIAEIVSGRGVNGAVKHCLALTRALARRGHDVTVVCLPDAWIARELAADRVVVSTLDRRPRELRRVARLLEERQVDVVHTHMSRAHFFGLASNLMRRILVDHARARLASKRGGGAALVSLDKITSPGDEDAGPSIPEPQHLDGETDTLFGVLWRADGHRMDAVPRSPVMQRWWAHMADIMETKPDNEPVAVPLETVFHMP